MRDQRTFSASMRSLPWLSTFENRIERSSGASAKPNQNGRSSVYSTVVRRVAKSKNSNVERAAGLAGPSVDALLRHREVEASCPGESSSRSSEAFTNLVLRLIDTLVGSELRSI